MSRDLQLVGTSEVVDPIPKTYSIMYGPCREIGLRTAVTISFPYNQSPPVSHPFLSPKPESELRVFLLLSNDCLCTPQMKMYFGACTARR